MDFLCRAGGVAPDVVEGGNGTVKGQMDIIPQDTSPVGKEDAPQGLIKVDGFHPICVDDYDDHDPMMCADDQMDIDV